MKTQTKKSPTKKASTQEKSPAAKKTASVKKTAPKAKAPATTKKTASVVAVSEPKQTSKKSIPTKKVAPVKKNSLPKLDTSLNSSPKTSTKEGVKMLGILHLVGNILSGGALGIILVIIYYFFQHEKLSQIEKDTCFEIINFNLSFILYMGIAVGLILAIVGVVLVPLVWLAWFVFLVLGFLSHLAGDNYRYPLTIRFVS